jgi:hypothetical protein
MFDESLKDEHLNNRTIERRTVEKHKAGDFDVLTKVGCTNIRTIEQSKEEHGDTHKLGDFDV